MSESSNLTPGKSLESDLRLIREAKGLTREDVFNRVHIRPEVLTQVEEFGFAATPTLSSDIHRRSFVKHYADAIEIDSAIALNALGQSLEGSYDGILAREYLGAETPGEPRWAAAAEKKSPTVEPTKIVDDLPGSASIGVVDSVGQVGEVRRRARPVAKKPKPAEPGPVDDSPDPSADDVGPGAVTDEDEIARVKVVSSESLEDEIPDIPPMTQAAEIPYAVVKETTPEPPEAEVIETAPDDAVVDELVIESVESEAEEPLPSIDSDQDEVSEVEEPPVAETAGIEEKSPDAGSHDIVVGAPHEEVDVVEAEPKPEVGEREPLLDETTVADPEELTAEPVIEEPTDETPAPVALGAEAVTEVEGELEIETASETVEFVGELEEVGKTTPVSESEPEPEGEPESIQSVEPEKELEPEDEPAEPEPTPVRREPVVPESPYAPPMPGVAVGSPTTAEEAPGPTKKVKTQREKSAEPSRRRRSRRATPPPPVAEPIAEEPPRAQPAERRESWSHVRTSHWITWLGLLGVLVVVGLFLIRSFTHWLSVDRPQTVKGRSSISIDALPERFSGFVRRDDSTEEFVTFVVGETDSLNPNTFQFRMWTHSAGSLYAMTGEAVLAEEGDQVTLPDPYGAGGVFVSEEGEVRMRSLRRLEFPRWEFTGQIE